MENYFNVHVRSICQRFAKGSMDILLCIFCCVLLDPRGENSVRYMYLKN